MRKTIASIAFCMISAVLFFVFTGASRRGLTVGLADVYGDTSGIRGLIIEGSVASWQGNYGYNFRIGPEGKADAEMLVFHDRLGLSNFIGPMPWHIPNIPLNPNIFDTVYLPIGPYEVVRQDFEQEPLFSSPVGGTPTLGRRETEFRVYGDVFAVEPRFRGLRVLLQGAPDEPRLFIDAGEGGYIVAHAPDVPFAGYMPHFNGPQWGHRNLLGHPFLADTIVRDDMYIYVPIGFNLFGETAVYGVWMGMDDSAVPTVGDAWETQGVAAVALVPIELAHGEDTIWGLLEIGGGFLLLIERGNRLEVIHYIYETGEWQSLFMDGPLTFDEIYAHEQGLVFIGARWIGASWDSVVWTFTIDGGALDISEPFPYRPGGEEIDDRDGRAFIRLHDALTRDGIIYFAYTVEQNPFHFPRAGTMTFISALRAGRLVGRAQVFNGVEEANYWVRTGEGSFGQSFLRELRRISIR